jgi:hypothetical protein
MKYIGNCLSIIDWDLVIKDCENTSPKYLGPSHSRQDNLPGLQEILDLWDLGGYKLSKDGGTVGWDMFIAGEQFDIAVVDKFCEFFEIDSYKSAWISRVNVGRVVPLHWDINDEETELSKLSNLKRFHCHIGKPHHGHVLIVENQCLYWQEQGSTYEWVSRKSWHAGANGGLVPKFLFNLW